MLLLTSAATAAAVSDGDCRGWLEDQHQRLQSLGITDPGTTAIPGYPHLRTNRWLAMLQSEVVSDGDASQWLAMAGQVALDSWRVRLRRADGDQAEQERLETCINRQVALSAFPGVPQVTVDDNYATSLRVLGLYPLTRLLAMPSINGYRREMAARFLAARPKAHHHYLPPAFPGAPPPPTELSVNYLEVPLPGKAARNALLAQYAPVITSGSDNPWDQPGRVLMETDGPRVDPGQPTAYQWIGWTRFRGHNLLQLNYQFWFTRRPAQGRMDLYAGHLDSLIWRVTLKPDGNVLFYDSIHGCGCYHKVYPVAKGLKAADLPDAPVFYPRLAANARDTRVALHLDPDTHYVVGISRFEPDRNTPTTSYRTTSADSLLALPTPRGYQSLYDERGLVPSSRRRERLLLWPLGVPSAGAMRQPGTHATAFIGRRHFDDPALPAQIFQQP